MKQKNLAIIFVALAAIVFLLGCTDTVQNNAVGNNSNENLTLGSGPNTQTSKTVEFTITAKQWEFEPSTITVTEGDLVTLVITSIDVDHGISIPGLGVNENLIAGQTTTIEFIADKKGNYSFSCNVYCGQGHSSMAGIIIIK